jgi:hypothetical protein
MNFFTPDLLVRFGSEDDQLAEAAHEEVELRTEAYVRALQEIEPKLPPRLRDLIDQFYLHDARVISQPGFVLNDLESIENSLSFGSPAAWTHGGAEGRRSLHFGFISSLTRLPGKSSSFSIDL